MFFKAKGKRQKAKGKSVELVFPLFQRTREKKGKVPTFCLLPFAFCLLILGALASRAAEPTPLFRDVTTDSNLRFHHFTGATGELYMPEIMGSGGALFDYDNDGDLDVYLIQSTLPVGKTMRDATYPPPVGQPVNWKPGNRLFRNELIPSGKLRFTDVTEKAGVGHIGYGMGAATGDIDNDGDLDLYVTNLGSNVLYRNNGNNTFTNITTEANVDDPRWSASAAFFDYDRDGDLDLFVTNYVDFTHRNHKRCFAPTGEPDYCTPRAYNPLRHRLFRNDGKNHFTDVSAQSGIGSIAAPGLGVTCADFNGDGWVDVYVANDGAANLLWLNQGNGQFEEVGLLAGAAYGMDGTPRAGMGATTGDFDNDGDQDVFVTNLTREGSTLYRNNGKAEFHDASDGLSITKFSFLSTGFGVTWFDYDNDGWLDLFAANGAVTMMPKLKGTPYPFAQPNQLFHNEGAKAFREINDASLKLAEVSRGLCTGDIDNDGDLDLLVTNNNGPARLFLNEAGKGRHWLNVKLEGVKDNRYGLGALIGVTLRGGKTLWRQAHTDGSYLSASDARVHFGLGMDAVVESVTVRWPSSEQESWQAIKADKMNVLRQGSGKPVQ